MQVENFINSLNGIGTLSHVGYTTLGEKIPMISKGDSEPKILLIGGVHAREYITSYLLRELMVEYGGKLRVDCVPMLNIDGVRLSIGGINALTLKMRDRIALLRINDGSTDFSQWKTNLRGVDLNVNFPADWGRGKSNVCYPSPENYVGPFPISENESYCVKRLIDEGNYALVACYHSKGEEVYYGFQNNLKYRAEALRIANALGYRLKKTPHSTGGIKDYFTLSTSRLGLTIEVGDDSLSHPIGLSHLDELKEKHHGIIDLFTEIATSLWKSYGL